MGKKKKRNSHPNDPGGGASAAQSPQAKEESVEILSVHATSSKGHLFERSTIVKMTEQDALKLGLQNGHKVFLISTKGDDHLSIVGVIVCQVSIFDSKGSPSHTSGRGGYLKCGNIKVSPPSALELLAGSTEFSKVSLAEPVASYTPVKSSVDEPTRFSFKQVSDGDALHSQARKSPYTPKSPGLELSVEVRVIPLNTNLGKAMTRNVCSEAKSIFIQLLDPKLDVSKMERLFKRIVLAFVSDRYVQRGERVRVSFQGKPVGIAITDGRPNDVGLEVTFGNLQLEDCGDVGGRILLALSNYESRLFHVTHATTIELAGDNIDGKLPSSEPELFVAGLTSTLDQVRIFLQSAFGHGATVHATRGLKPPRGVLLHGPNGIGKSSLAMQLASELETTVSVSYVNCTSLQSKTGIVGEAERQLSRLFRAPSVETKPILLIFDDIHLICLTRGGYAPSTDGLVATLLSLIDGLGVNERVVILATTSNPSLLDPALRRPGRIDTEVEVPLPDEPTVRAEILRFQVLKLGASVSDMAEDTWLELAKVAKGFTGADCKLAVKEAIRRAFTSSRETGSSTASGVQLTVEDMKAGIRSTKPSAIKSVTVEIPKVLWSDIGGMDSVKQELREAIEQPLAHSELFRDLGVPPPRGVLLYGPPGCSKTLMARALATEGQMNFLAVKGPELLSKWLGESERSLASLFRRARMASPCIIFFDEIDAIAMRRGTGDSASSSRLLSQLLTELDGIHYPGSASSPKHRVVVVGATNRPDLLDPALTRPGRIDRMIYVGVPDAASRSQIFRISLQGRSCNSDVDVDHLSRDEISGGYSGAEIVAICRDAAFLALEEADNVHASEAAVSMRHLLGSIEGMKRQITPSMIEFYSDFQKSVRKRG